MAARAALAQAQQIANEISRSRWVRAGDVTAASTAATGSCASCSARATAVSSRGSASLRSLTAAICSASGRVSQMRTVVSPEVEKSCRPSGLHASEKMYSVCPPNWATFSKCVV